MVFLYDNLLRFKYIFISRSFCNILLPLQYFAGHATFFSSLKVSVNNCSNVVDLSPSGIILPHSGIALYIELLQEFSSIPYQMSIKHFFRRIRMQADK
jgi:hypothetical protein